MKDKMQIRSKSPEVVLKELEDLIKIGKNPDGSTISPFTFAQIMTVVNCLAKEIGREVEISSYNIGFCPVCKGSVWQVRSESHYCFRCGHKLIWRGK